MEGGKLYNGFKFEVFMLGLEVLFRQGVVRDVDFVWMGCCC